MKRTVFPGILTVIIVFFFISAGVTSSWSSSLPDDVQKDNHPAEGSLNPRLSHILENINMSLVSGYLEDIVAIGPRPNERIGGEQAAAYIVEQFESMGLITYTQPWQSVGNRGHPGTYSGHNVVGELPGTNAADNAIFIFNAHYDTVRNTPGADDDASGVAAVLAAAHVLSQYRFSNTLKFIAFSGEEVGLLGSHCYARRAYDNAEAIAVVFNADMIGHGSGVNASRFRIYGTEDAAWILENISSLNENASLNFTLTTGFIDRSGSGGSDYASFAHYGYETVAFFEYEWNPHMHTPEDDLDNINISYLVNTTRLIAIALADLAGMPNLPAQIVIDAPVRGALNVNGNVLLSFPSPRTIVVGETVISATLRFGTTSVDRVEFFLDDELVHIDAAMPYFWIVDQPVFGKHDVTVTLYTDKGDITSDTLSGLFISR